MALAFLLSCAIYTGNTLAGEAKREELKAYGHPYTYPIYHHSIKAVKQATSPVMITRASAVYIPKSTADAVRDLKDGLMKKDWWNYRDEGVLISLDVVSETAVVVQYGVQIFNSFNEYLGGLGLTSMDPPEHEMTWLYRHSDIFTFKGYGYAFVFVAKARLKDGTIWTYDAKEVSSQISPKVKRLKLDEEQ